jgi:peptidoglycan/xylan/chitin deacetylase (PgdA/CDA1 family)
MYHELYPADRPGYLETTGIESPGKRLYAISDRAFAGHLELLRRRGFLFARVGDDGGGGGDVCAAMITFDDGGSSAWDLAVPLLERFGARATFFVCGDLVGRPGYLDRAQLVEMDRRGHQIGSHSMSHRPLTGLPERELERELGESKRYLEELLGRPCEAFCIPGGNVGAREWRKIADAGYRAVCTSRPPSGLPLERGLSRWAVRAGWGERELEALVDHERRFTLPIVARHYAMELAKQAVGRDRFLRLRQRLLAWGG